MLRLLLANELTELTEFLEAMTSTHGINADHEYEAKEVGSRKQEAGPIKYKCPSPQEPRLDGGDQSDALNS